MSGPATLQSALDTKLDKAGGTISSSLIVDGTVTAGSLTVGRVVPPQGQDGRPWMDVAGGLRAQTIQSTNPMQHRMYPTGATVYENIFDALGAGLIAERGSPQYDATSHTANNPLNHRPTIMFGGNSESESNGAQVTIPAGFDTLWIRVLGDRWNVVHAYFLDGGWRPRPLDGRQPKRELLHPRRKPDRWHGMATPMAANPRRPRRRGGAGLQDSNKRRFLVVRSGVQHEPVGACGTVCAAASAGSRMVAMQSPWTSDNWGGDVLAQLNQQSNLQLMVPVLPSGRDKLLYLIGSDPDDPPALAHSGITVNGQAIERFSAGYDNPFARHWNSKWRERYVAARVPAGSVPSGQRFLDVQHRHDVPELGPLLPRDRDARPRRSVAAMTSSRAG